MKGVKVCKDEVVHTGVGLVTWHVKGKVLVLLHNDHCAERAVVKVDIAAIIESERTNAGKRNGCEREEYSREASLEVALQAVVLAPFFPGSRKHSSFSVRNGLDNQVAQSEGSEDTRVMRDVVSWTRIAKQSPKVSPKSMEPACPPRQVAYVGQL